MSKKESLVLEQDDRMKTRQTDKANLALGTGRKPLPPALNRLAETEHSFLWGQ